MRVRARRGEVRDVLSDLNRGHWCRVKQMSFLTCHSLTASLCFPYKMTVDYASCHVRTDMYDMSLDHDHVV